MNAHGLGYALELIGSNRSHLISATYMSFDLNAILLRVLVQEY